MGVASVSFERSAPRALPVRSASRLRLRAPARRRRRRRQFVSLQGEGSWSVTSALGAVAERPCDRELVRQSQLRQARVVPRPPGPQCQERRFRDLRCAVHARRARPRTDGGAGAFISAPIQVATLATFVEPPSGGFQAIVTRCDPDDRHHLAAGRHRRQHPVHSSEAPYSGPSASRVANLGAMFLHYLFGGVPAAGRVEQPRCPGAFGVDPDRDRRPPRRPGYAGRSDPDEITYFLQTFVKTAAPDVWQGNVAANPTVPWDPITERLGQVIGRHARRRRAAAGPARAGWLRDDRTLRQRRRRRCRTRAAVDVAEFRGRRSRSSPIVPGRAAERERRLGRTHPGRDQQGGRRRW